MYKMKYKEKYKPGMIFRSEKNPWADMMIDYVCYIRDVESAYNFNMESVISWQRINHIAFDKHVCLAKGYDYNPGPDGKMSFKDKTTFPYAWFGEGHQKTIDEYIRKYELKFDGMSDRSYTVTIDNEMEYFASIEYMED